MISFTNRRSNKIQRIKNMQNVSAQIRLINLARLRKNKSAINNISDTESVFDETSSVYDDLNSVNGDFDYLTEEPEYNNHTLGSIKEEGEEPLSPFRKYVLMLDAKYRNK